MVNEQHIQQLCESCPYYNDNWCHAGIINCPVSHVIQCRLEGTMDRRTLPPGMERRYRDLIKKVSENPCSDYQPKQDPKPEPKSRFNDIDPM
jgi:hypothetical protein